MRTKIVHTIEHSKNFLVVEISNTYFCHIKCNKIIYDTEMAIEYIQSTCMEQ